jgi:hypothetical protein
MKSELIRFHCLALLLSLTAVASLPAAEPIPLRAGPLTMLFEPDNAVLRYVKLGSHEMLRGITAPVRDNIWGTVRPVVTNLTVDSQPDHFTLRFDAVCREREIDFTWHGTINGQASGAVEYTFDGIADSTFEKNRIGFCVLHAPSAAGKPWVIETVSGEKSKGSFPVYISPHQPAKNLREIAHELVPGLWAHVRMEGDTFEMEDQRNWTDASFKTYCTPLEIPYPVRIEKGTKIAQKISIRLEGSIPTGATCDTHGRTILTLSNDQTPLPPLGLQVSSQTDELSGAEVKNLKALHLDHLRVDLTLTNSDFPRHLRAATTQAKALGVPLHVGLRLGAQPEQGLNQLATELKSVRPSVSLWLIIEADEQTYQLARKSLGPYRGKAPIGTVHEDISFVQLNRVRPSADMMQVVSYGVTPQIHAFDNVSMVETLPILVDTVRSARQFVGERPLIISPITLRPPAVVKQPLPGELPSNVDVRQPSNFAAAWTLGCIKYLSEAGVQSLTCFETVGWRGIMESAQGTLLPIKFPSKPASLFPVYHVLHALSEFEGGRVQRMDSSDTLSVVGLALKKGKRTRLMIANLTDHQQSAAIRGLGDSLDVRPLEDESKSARAAAPETTALELPLELEPYSILVIDRG